MFLDNNIDVNKLADQLGAAANKVAEASGPMVAHGYHVYVEQQVIIGWEQLIGGILLVVLGVVGLLIAKCVSDSLKTAKSEYLKKYGSPRGIDLEGHCNEGHYTLITIAAILGVMLLTASPWFIAAGVGHIINPEYGAIQDIVNTATAPH